MSPRIRPFPFPSPSNIEVQEYFSLWSFTIHPFYGHTHSHVWGTHFLSRPGLWNHYVMIHILMSWSLATQTSWFCSFSHNTILWETPHDILNSELTYKALPLSFPKWCGTWRLLPPLVHHNKSNHFILFIDNYSKKRGLIFWNKNLKFLVYLRNLRHL